MTQVNTPLLAVSDLNITFKVHDGKVHAVNHLSFQVHDREILGIVGESGSGKSQSMLAVMGLLASNSQVSGSIQFQGQELLGMPRNELNKLRGNHLSMVFQDPMTSLNPYLPISTQLTEVLQHHQKLNQRQALEQAIQMLDKVQIPEARRRIHYYPHEFSGGMRQRVMIAMALLTKPKLLIADEPTTALDVTVQAQILQLLKELKDELNMSIIFITHDLGVVANLCDRVNVMYAGTLMESADCTTIFKQAAHPYTQALLATIPNLQQSSSRLATIPGEPPNLALLPSGCPFQPRCHYRQEICAKPIPQQILGSHHHMRCVRALETLND